MNFDRFKFTNGDFKVKDFDTSKTPKLTREEGEQLCADNNEKMQILQDKLYAERKQGLLIVFQAMDAAGKDGAVKHVFSGLNPLGVNVYSFKKPSDEEESHDYLWRVSKAAPKRGMISIFNRSHYESVLVEKVHKLYEIADLPDYCKQGDVIKRRYKHIKNYEQYLYENGIKVIKFFINISKKEQSERFFARIDEKAKNWKFSSNDIKEREHWDEYLKAFEKAINATSTDSCPWYVVPGDSKWYARAVISEVVVKALEEMDPKYPKLPKQEQALLGSARDKLINEGYSPKEED